MENAVDPEIAAVLPMLPPGDYQDPAGGRARLKQLTTTMLAHLAMAGVALRDVLVPGPEKARDVHVRVHTPDRIAAMMWPKKNAAERGVYPARG